MIKYKLISTLLFTTLAFTSYSQEDSLVFLRHGKMRTLYSKWWSTRTERGYVSDIKAGEDTIHVKMFFKKGSNPLYYALDDYKKSSITLRGINVCTDTILLFNIYDTSYRKLSLPVTFAPDDVFNLGNYYYINANTEYLICEGGPFACNGSGCGYSYFMVYELQDKVLINVFAIVMPAFKSNKNMFFLKNEELYALMPGWKGEVNKSRLYNVTKRERVDSKYYPDDMYKERLK